MKLRICHHDYRYEHYCPPPPSVDTWLIAKCRKCHKMQVMTKSPVELNWLRIGLLVGVLALAFLTLKIAF